ncbi:MAG: TonB-dependent receptor [Prevotellaceae bacterium]|jgi:TonB-linked SusC/RagA family outer membrane protein|nr:TonB-dependent receptor [Prevotellaceae bacterium]
MKKFLMFSIACLLVSVSAFAQTKTVTGKVISGDDRQGIPGATVLVKETNKGEATDNDGNFSIQVSTGQTLQFSAIGYADQTIAVGDNNVINVTLQQDVSLLTESVVVGYGTQRRENLTGAVATVDVEKTFNGKPVADVTKALQGIAPGLSITYKSGNLGSDATINLRGTGTIIDGKASAGAPLILVDGVATDLTLVNPNDIANISVLKDAASASIYGARAAFGVVLITTKKGQQSDKKVRISYSSNFALSKPSNLIEFVDPEYELPVLMYAADRNTPGAKSESFGMYHEVLLPKVIEWKQKYANNRNGKEMIYGEDWEIINGRAYTYRVWDPHKEMLRNWTPTQNHNLSVQGNIGEESSYMVSLGYMEQSGFMRIQTDKLKRFNTNISFDTKLAKWLKAGFNVQFARKNHEEPYNYYDGGGLNVSEYNGYFGYYLRWGEYFPYGTYEGKYFRHAPGYMNAASMNSLQTDLMRLNTNLVADITPDLKFNVEYSFTTERADRVINGHPVQLLDFWSGGWDANDIMNTAYKYVVAEGNAHDKVALGNSNNQNHVLNAYFTYSKQFGEDHNLKITAGSNIEDNEFRRIYAERRNVMDESLIDIALTNGDQYVTSTWNALKPAHNEYAIAGFFGRINYDYKRKYLLEVNARYDGSSRFPVGHLWGFFPSASVGYRISEEPFMQKVKDIANDIKIRASVGSIGNQTVSSNAFRPMMTSGTADWIVGASLPMSVLAPPLVDPALTWETVTTYDIGLDVQFLKNMFGLSFDWYQRTNTDILTTGKALPQGVGASAPLTNTGELRTRGYELSANFNYAFNKDISVYAVVTLSDYQTVVTKFNNPSKTLGFFYEGAKIGDIWGFETDRLFQADDFNADGSFKTGIPSQNKLITGNFKYGPGDVKYKNLDGDDEISAGDRTADNPGDMKVIGNSTPRYEYSIRIGGRFYGFDIDIFFQGVGKRDYWANSDLVLPLFNRADALYGHQMDYWTPENTNAYFPNPYYPHATNAIGAYASGSNNFVAQSRYLLNMAYLRLKNLTIGYTLPVSLTQKIGIDKLRIYFSGQNLFEIKDSRLPVDPEINETEAQWGRTYPYPRTVSLGLQVNF